MQTIPIINFEELSLQNYFFSSNQPMWIIDLDFVSVLEINNTVTKIFGYSKEEIILQKAEGIFSQTEKQKLVKLLAASHSAENPVKKEINFKSRSGKIIYMDTVLNSILFDGREALLFTMTDITEKKIYRELLEQSIDQEISLKASVKKLKDMALLNFQQARKPLANILGLVNVLDESVVADKTLLEAIEFLRESGNELDGLIRGLDPQQF